MVLSCPSDESVGWLTGGCGVDFTLAFEDHVLILGPAACLLLFALLRLKKLWSRSIKVMTPTTLQLSKTTSALLFVSFACAVLITNCARSKVARLAEIPASIIAFIASLVAFALSYCEHLRSIRPSRPLQLYLIATLIVEIIRVRTIWNRHDDIVLQGLGIGSAVSCAIFLSAESAGKQDILLIKKRRSPQDVNGLFSERTFWWLNGLLRKGYRSILAPVDLDQTDEELSSPEINRRFRLTRLKHYHRGPNVSIVRIIFSTLRNDILFPVIPRALLLTVNFAQPYLVLRLVRYIGNAAESSAEEGVSLVIATALVYTAIATFQSWYWQSQTRFLVKLRGCLTTALHDKVLRCRTDLDFSPLTLMNVDIERVLYGLREIHEFWAVTLAIGISLWLLYSEVGIIFVAPLIFLVALIAIISFNGTKVAPKQKLWFAATQKRISYITNVISSMKNIKLLGIVPSVFRQGTKLRDQEIDAQKVARKAILLNVGLSNATYQLATLVLYSAYALRTHFGGEPLTTTRLFTSLSILKLFTSPMLSTIQAIPGTLQAISSIQRIQDYLNIDDHEDKRQVDFRGKTHPSPQASDAFCLGDEIPVVQMNNVTCTYSSDEPALFDISCKLYNGTLTIVNGPVGSGKSTLLRTLLGETKILSGTVSITTKDAALCDQNQWLWHASVRDNICGMYSFDTDWFEEVSWACGLQEDFMQFPEGIHTLIGSDGTSLSGGQRNRISLARALYSRKRLAILDDVLSGLDSRTEKLVFERVVGPGGLFKKMKCTVLLATHSLGWSCYADQLINLDRGRITFQGPPSHGTEPYLSMDNISFQSAPLLDYATKVNHEACMVNESPESSRPTPAEARLLSDVQVYKHYFASFGITMLIIYFIGSTLFVGASSLQSLWLTWWAAAESTAPQTLAKYGGIYAGITVVYVLIVFAFLSFSFLIMLPKSAKHLHAEQWAALVKVAYSSWGSRDTGGVTNRFSQDISIIDTQLSMSFVNATTIAFICIASTALLIVATPYLGVAIPILLLLLWAIQKFYLRTSKQLRVMDLEAKAPLCTHFLETVSGVVTINAYGWSEKCQAKNEELLSKSQVPFYLFASIQNWLMFVMNLVVAGIAAIIVAIAVRLSKDVDAGYIGLALVQTMDLGTYAENLILAWTGLENSLGAIYRMREFIEDMPTEEQGRVTPPLDWMSQGRVEIVNLLASYSDTAEPILKNINLKVSPGERVAICGRTGSGKSSLASAMFGLLHVRRGQIRVDGVDITAVSQDFLRSKMVAIPQEPYFTPGSVRDNLTLSTSSECGVTDATMLDALRKVGLLDKFDNLATTFGDTWHNALDLKLTPIDMLTKGQMQLFAMARAILSPGQLVLVDEVTSALDLVSETLIQKILREEFPGRTIVAIAHHLATIIDFDTVIVMDDGRIAEIGHPSTLANTEGSMFQQLLHATDESIKRSY